MSLTTIPPQSARADRRWWALALLAMAEFVVVLDASIVNIALPSIGRGLRFSLANLSWVVNAYVLTFGGFLLLGGRIADLLGRRRVFVIGLVLFVLASMAGGLAQSAGWLIGARAIQGLGAALLAPAALSLVTATFREGSERNRALSIWGAVAGSGAAAGVLLGGVLTSAFGWRSVLFVNVPIGIIVALLTPLLVAESRAQLARRSFEAVLLLSAPLLVFSLVVGLLISIFQAVTSINEATLAFAPKIIAVMVAMIIFFPWMMTYMSDFTREVYSLIATMRR